MTMLWWAAFDNLWQRVLWWTYWCTVDGVSYLLAPSRYSDIPRFTVIRCRFRGHPCGVVWYSSGYEPDLTCKDCGDDLG